MTTGYMYYLLNEDGTTYGVDTMPRWPTHEERRVDRTEITDDVHVSTVFLVLDHGYGGVPMLFESMIFGGEHDEWCERYSTRDEARAGHTRIVANLRAGREPDADPNDGIGNAP